MVGKNPHKCFLWELHLEYIGNEYKCVKVMSSPESMDSKIQKETQTIDTWKKVQPN